MKDYYKGSAYRKLRSRRTRSLLPYLSRSGLLPRRKLVRLQASPRSHWPRMMPSSKRSSMVNVKTLPSFVKHAFGLSPRLNAQEPKGFLTSLSEANFLYRYRITALSRDVGLLRKAQQSTCKTSSEAVSYAKQLWLPKGTVWSSVTSHKLNREFSRGFRITTRCLTSSGQVVTLTPRSALRCLTYPDLLRSLIPTSGSLRRVRSWAAGMDSGGRRSRPSFLWGSLARRLNATTKPLPKHWESIKPMPSGSWTGKTT